MVDHQKINSQWLRNSLKGKQMKLTCVNSDESLETRIASISRIAKFCGEPCIDPDAGFAFDFLPDGPGVICWWNDDGSIATIDVVRISLRTRLTEIYQGKSGSRAGFGSKIFGFESTHSPDMLKDKIMAEHFNAYSRMPEPKIA